MVDILPVLVSRWACLEAVVGVVGVTGQCPLLTMTAAAVCPVKTPAAAA